MRPASLYVVDASVVIKWVLTEPGWQQAWTLKQAAARRDIVLLAPDFCLNEAANALWKRCRLRGEISEEEAAAGLRLISLTLGELAPSAVLIEQALQLALAFRHPVYDCVYVALALREDCQLITADRHLLQQLAPALGHITALEDFVLN